VLTGVSVAGALAATFLIEYPKQPRWAGGVLFDDDIRSALRVRQHGARDAIRLASDLTLLTNLLQVAVIDSVVIPLADRSPGIAAQLSLINAQAFALNVLVSTVLFKIVARQRPLISDCERDADFDPLCKIGQYASFPSSHTSTAFTAAGLTCVHHQHLPLYGGPWDLVACIESLTVAFATGLFRSMGDRHYATDVLMGAAIGLTVGYLYPWLSHYRVTSDSPTAAERADPMAPRSVTMPMPAYTFSFGGEL
jgi:membrane-associated phospholipid phosphatase